MECGNDSGRRGGTGIGLAIKPNNGSIHSVYRDQYDIGQDETIDKENVLGVVFRKEGLSVVIAKEPVQCYFCGGNSVCTGAEGVTDASTAMEHLNGREQTTALTASLKEPSWAVNVCSNTAFGVSKGYLPASGEMKRVLEHRTEINALMAKCGLDGLVKDHYWSSTLGPRKDSEGNGSQNVNDKINTVIGLYGDAAADGFNCQGYYWAWPFCEYDGSIVLETEG